MTEALSLADLLERKPLEPIQVTYVALGLIQALERVHGQGRVCGRLTPRDVLLTDPISLAKAFAPPDPAYQTPEHLHGQAITARTDLYGFGLLLYELLARRPPFVASDLDVLRHRQLEWPVPDPRVHNPELDLDLVILLLSLLDKNPAFRPASAAEVRRRLMSIWQPGTVSTPPRPEALVGQLLSRCQVESLIGEGRLAWVFLAHDVFDKQPFAVKVFKPDVIQDPALLARFRRDAAAIFELDSPYIARLLGAGDFAGLWYLLIQHVRGRSLRDLINASVQQESPFSRQEILTHVEQVAQALTRAHENGVAHGDLTPCNIILSDQGRAIVTDFGLAAIQPVESEHPALSGIERVQGTPAYMAPEQIREGAITPAADVYALGVVAYELLAGQPPLVGDTEAEVLIQHLETTPPPVQDHRPELPEEVNTVLGQALAKDPAGRFRSPAAFARALDKAWYVPPPPPPPPPPRPPMSTRVRDFLQRPAVQRVGTGATVAAIGLFTVCLLVGGGLLILLAGLGVPAAPPGTPARSVTPGTATVPLTGTMTVTTVPTTTVTGTPGQVVRTYYPKYDGPQHFPGCAIRGRVFNAAGKGEADVWVELYNSNKQWLLNVATGPGGWYDITTSPGGYYMKLKNRRSVWSPLILLKFEEMGVVDWYAR